MPLAAKQADSIFWAAQEIPSSDKRAAYLDEACGNDPALRAQIEEMLAAYPKVERFLESPAVGLLPSPSGRGAGGEGAPTIDREPPATEHAGSHIGPYKLLEQIGEGGMGVVYVAEQTEPVRRRVALKIIKPGMDTKQVIARFEAERQALAMMDHPNIARVLDAGTIDVGPGRRTGPESSSLAPDSRPLTPGSGRPYFVMELVRGLPITEYCDKARQSPRQRLELFVDVCNAVQHAHQKGVIHRDLKPSNVMVTVHDGRPVAKVIDFGVAKAVGQQLTERTVYTAHTQLVGTPLYMSPEQADLSSHDVDTRSDVYSLGVLLYELLTGQTPFDKEALTKAGFDEMRRIIREDEPPRPSHRVSTLNAQASSTISQQRGLDERHLGRILRGELDWIVMKALEKDRSRRFESAGALAADIQRYLSDEPVLACPPTTMYRFQKFARKHKPALFTAAAIALCLLLGTTVSAWQAVRATTAEAEATANADQAKTSALEAKEKAAEATAQRDEVKALADKLAAKEEELQQTLYADHIYMAKEAWDSGNVTRATSLLKKHIPQPGEPDRRGFEWHYLNRLSHIGPLLSIQTPMALAGELAISRDGARLIRFKRAGTQPRNGERTATPPTLQVWNLQSGQEELTAELSGVPDGTASRRQAMPRFTPDGARMLINTSRWDNATQAYIPGEVKVWDTRTGKQILSIGGVIRDVVFSPNGMLLVTAMEDQSVKLWDLQTGQERLTLKGQLEFPHAFAFSSDGKRLAAAGNKWDDTKNAAVGGEIKIWDVQTRELVLTLKGHKEWMTNLVFSPDGQRLASSAEGTGAIKLWDAQTGHELRTFPLGTEDVYETEFNADGTRLIGAGHKIENEELVRYTKMWNTQTGQELLSFKNCPLEFTPDGKRVAVTDRTNSRTKVFDAQSGQIMLSVANAGGKLAFSPDSKRLATKSGGMRIWDLETGDEINHIKGFIGDFILAFSQDGKRLVGSNQYSVQVWDAEIEQQSARKLTLSGVNRISPHTMGDTPAVFSPEFMRLAGISYKTVKLFDVNSGQELRTFTGHENNVICVAFSPDGKRIAAGDGQRLPGGPPNSGVVKVWDADTGSELFTINMPDRAIAHLVFSADGKKLAGSARDRTATVWEVQSGREIRTFGAKSAGFSPPGIMLDFSPDSRRLAFAGKIYDAETGQELVTLKDGVGCMTFSPDGKRILGVTRRLGRGVFDAESGEFLFNVPFSLTGCETFSPDGKRLANSSTIWDAQTGQELLSLGQERSSGGGSGQVAFSPDGHRLAVVKALSNEVTIYDATPLPEKP